MSFPPLFCLHFDEGVPLVGGAIGGGEHGVQLVATGARGDHLIDIGGTATGGQLDAIKIKIDVVDDLGAQTGTDGDV